ncbi:MAG: hypothetical protein EXR08_10430 [Alphaproteobacteria bacterium]|nr:hypothetical protein [Alphaproteobacteria bacterium]
MSGRSITVGVFGVIFLIALMLLAIKFPKPTDFQYTTFRIVLALAAGGIAPLIPGLLEVDVYQIVKAGGALGVFTIVYFFSPAKLIVSQNHVDLPTLMGVWKDIRAPNTDNINVDMAHKALNAISLITWYWKKASPAEKRLIISDSFGPF